MSRLYYSEEEETFGFGVFMKARTQHGDIWSKKFKYHSASTAPGLCVHVISHCHCHSDIKATPPLCA